MNEQSGPLMQRDPPLVYSTYLGGSGFEWGFGIAVDAEGNAYLTGSTRSVDFPTANALQPTFGGGEDFFGDAFVAKLNPTGSALLYSTYLGGSVSEWGSGIAVDAEGNAYVTGVTSSADFPIVNPLQPTLAGDTDAFVAKLNPTGSALVYSTYLGGSERENAFWVGWSEGSIAVDAEGNAYVVGSTGSTDFPTAGFQIINGGLADAFIVKITKGQKLYFAQFGNGQRFTSDTVLTNPSVTATVSGNINLSDDNGLPLPIGIAARGDDRIVLSTIVLPLQLTSTVDFSIPPLGAVTISTDGEGDVEVGSAVVTSTSTLERGHPL